MNRQKNELGNSIYRTQLESQAMQKVAHKTKNSTVQLGQGSLMTDGNGGQA